MENRNIVIKLYICTKKGDAVAERTLYSGEDKVIAQAVYEAACVTVEAASAQIPLRVVFITLAGCEKSYEKKR